MKLLSLILIALVAGTVAAQEEPPVLRNNPFSRPASDVVIDDRVSIPSEEREVFAIELRATMIGSVNKLANVGGQILRTGDVVQGYRIAQIHEQYVVFERDGYALTVYVKPLYAEDQERESVPRGRTNGRRQ